MPSPRRDLCAGTGRKSFPAPAGLFLWHGRFYPIFTAGEFYYGRSHPFISANLADPFHHVRLQNALQAKIRVRMKFEAEIQVTTRSGLRDQCRRLFSDRAPSLWIRWSVQSNCRNPKQRRHVHDAGIHAHHSLHLS